MRELSHRPVRASEIRALEHAAALAWPGTEQHWQDGWLLRAGGYTSRANSAVPLDFAATVATLPGDRRLVCRRGLPPWLALPDRLLPVRGLGGGAGVKHTRVMVADLPETTTVAGAVLLDRPDAAWLARYGRDVPPAVLTAVVDGEVVFATAADAAVGRGAVTTAPDGTRWLGISAFTSRASTGGAAMRPDAVPGPAGVGRRPRCRAGLRAGADRQRRRHRAVRLAGLRPAPSSSLRRCPRPDRP